MQCNIDPNWLQDFDTALKRYFLIDHAKADMGETELARYADLRPHDAALQYGDDYDVQRVDIASREVAASGISDYIDGLYSPARRDNHFGGVSPDELEAAHRPRRSSVQLNKALVNRMLHRFLKLL